MGEPIRGETPHADFLLCCPAAQGRGEQRRVVAVGPGRDAAERAFSPGTTTSMKHPTTATKYPTTSTKHANPAPAEINVFHPPPVVSRNTPRQMGPNSRRLNCPHLRREVKRNVLLLALFGSASFPCGHEAELFVKGDIPHTGAV